MELERLKQQKWEDVASILPDVLADYETDITEAEKRLSIRGKTAVEAYKDQTAWPVYYGVRKAELTKLLKYMEAQVAACRGRLFRKYVENYSRDISDRVREQYINGEPEYLGYNELYLEISELRDKFAAVCDAFDRRGFALRDWTALKIESLHEDII